LYFRGGEASVCYTHACARTRAKQYYSVIYIVTPICANFNTPAENKTKKHYLGQKLR